LKYESTTAVKAFRQFIVGLETFLLLKDVK